MGSLVAEVTVSVLAAASASHSGSWGECIWGR
jgi:hypothetical protein